jgi:hypothetical protein
MRAMLSIIFFARMIPNPLAITLNQTVLRWLQFRRGRGNMLILCKCCGNAIAGEAKCSPPCGGEPYLCVTSWRASQKLRESVAPQEDLHDRELVNLALIQRSHRC